MLPSTSWPLSSLTRNIVLGRASVISPSISIFSSAMRRRAYLTSVFQGSGPVVHLTRVLRRLQLRQQLSQLRPRFEPQLTRQLVAPEQWRRRPAAAPVEGG